MSEFSGHVNRILRELKSGDTSKRRILCDVTYSRLKITAIKYLINRNDYEDVLQEAYLRVFKYINTYDCDKGGFSWMCEIVKNIAYDFNKKENQNISLEDVALLNEESLFDTELWEKGSVEREVGKLEENDRRLLYLRFWQDKTYREIAKITGLKKSAVHKRISKLANDTAGTTVNTIIDVISSLIP